MLTIDFNLQPNYKCKFTCKKIFGDKELIVKICNRIEKQ